MTRVSKETLSPALTQQLFDELIGCFVKANRKSLTLFLGTLLTPTERIMLVKRVAVITMLRDGCTVYHIAHILHMSTSTVSEMNNNLEKGKYDDMFPVMKWSKKEREKFWDTLEFILRGGLPRRVGFDRYNWLSKHIKQ